jgi:hypothetical protein
VQFFFVLLQKTMPCFALHACVPPVLIELEREIVHFEFKMHEHAFLKLGKRNDAAQKEMMQH